MGKRKLNSKTKYVSLILVFALVAISCLSWITYAWFTSRKDFSGNLTFGTVELDVSGTGVDNTKKELKFSTARNDSTWTGNIMPGDTINIPLTISLTSTSEDAYYIVQITDDKNIFENAYYYSQNGTDVYVNNGSTITKQGTTTVVTSPVVGKLLKGTSGHNITIGAKISEDFEQKGISTTIECNIYAIQVANLSEADAYTLLNKQATTVATLASGAGIDDDTGTITMPAWQTALPDILEYKTIGFYKKGQQPATTTFNSELTTAYNNAVTNADDKNLIEVYTNGTTELALVSEYKIYAPQDSTLLFAIIDLINGKDGKVEKFVFDNFYAKNVTNATLMLAMNNSLTELNLSGWDLSGVTDISRLWEGCDNLTSIDLSYVDLSDLSSLNDIFKGNEKLVEINLEESKISSKVTDMSAIFQNCSSLTTLNLSNFNATNVTDMSRMLQGCSSLTNLNLSSFNTSKVTNMNSMFSWCTSLTSLDLSSFNTSNVTSMNNMFNRCTSLTNLDLSSFDTSSVTDMFSMFAYCSSLTSLNLSSFNTSNVTNMSSMFIGCSSLTNLDLSSFNTSNVTNMYGMFRNCSRLTNLDLSLFNTSNVTNMGCMFDSCSNLTNLDLSSFNTSNVTDWTTAFSGCSSLTRLDISSKFTNKETAFTKESLCFQTNLPTSVAVYRDGELLA